MPRFRLQFLLPIIFIAACSTDDGTPIAERKQPNILIIVSDALRQDVLGCHGGEARTPNIDQLAQSGVLFENAYTNSSWTAPSVVNMFTGRYADTYGTSPFRNTIRIHVPNSEAILSKALKATGYATIAMVENIHALLHNCLQGFEPPPKSDNDKTRATITRIVGRDLSRELAERKELRDLINYMAWLLEAPKDQSFFTLYWLLDPHEPYAPVDRFKSRIDIDPLRLTQPESFYQQPKLQFQQLSDAEQDYIKKLYVAEVESVDEKVGFIIETLHEANVLDNTYIVFTADHGEMFGEHGRWGHHVFYYDALMKIPLIISGPGLPEGARRNTPVSLIDVMPTLKDLLGLVYEHDMQGESFHSVLLGNEAGDRSIYFTNVLREEVDYAQHADALRDGDFKLIAWDSGELELFDLGTDIGEETNVAEQYPEMVKTMYEKMEHQRETNEARRLRNMVATADTTNLSSEEMREAAKKLRALGYVK